MAVSCRHTQMASDEELKDKALFKRADVLLCIDPIDVNSP